MNIKELKKLIENTPDEYQVRLGSMYDPVVYAKEKTVSYNKEEVKCLHLSDEDEEY